MCPSVMGRQDLHVFDIAAAVGPLVLDAEIRELDMIGDDRQVVGVRPLVDLLTRTARPPIRIGSIAIGLLEELLILALQLIVEDHALDACPLPGQPIRAVQVGSIELRIVCEFAGFYASRGERLEGLMVGCAVSLQDITATLGERDEGCRGVAASGRHAANETGRAEPVEVAVPEVPWPPRVVFQIVRRDHAKRPNSCQRADLGPAQFVLVVVNVHGFALAASGQVETLGHDVARINSFHLSRIRQAGLARVERSWVETILHGVTARRTSGTRRVPRGGGGGPELAIQIRELPTGIPNKQTPRDPVAQGTQIEKEEQDAGANEDAVLPKEQRLVGRQDKNAMATTGMNEYWMKAFSQLQNSQSSFGTMRNGTKIGPSRPQTALAIRPNAMTARERAFAKAMRSSTVQ